jgi:Myb-like DNA-binding domain
MAPSNSSILSSSPAPGAAGSPPSATTATATGMLRGDYTIITSRPSSSSPSRSGRWTPDEKLLFLHGLKLHGRGRWKRIRQFLPTRYVPTRLRTLKASSRNFLEHLSHVVRFSDVNPLIHTHTRFPLRPYLALYTFQQNFNSD